MVPGTGETLTVPASEVAEGDFLPGLGNGFVFVDPETDPDVRGEYNVALGDPGYVMVTFHDAEGNENYVLCAPDMPVTVQRGAMI